MGRHNPDDPTTAKYRKGWGWNPGDAMDGQGDLFSLARESDPQTSHDAVPSPGSRARQKAALLEVYRQNPEGLTAREAGRLVGNLEAWKRVSDLLNEGALVNTGLTRKDADTGRAGRVLRLAS